MVRDRAASRQRRHKTMEYVVAGQQPADGVVVFCSLRLPSVTGGGGIRIRARQIRQDRGDPSVQGRLLGQAELVEERTDVPQRPGCCGRVAAERVQEWY